MNERKRKQQDHFWSVERYKTVWIRCIDDPVVQKKIVDWFQELLRSHRKVSSPTSKWDLKMLIYGRLLTWFPQPTLVHNIVHLMVPCLVNVSEMFTINCLVCLWFYILLKLNPLPSKTRFSSSKFKERVYILTFNAKDYSVTRLVRHILMHFPADLQYSLFCFCLFVCQKSWLPTIFALSRFTRVSSTFLWDPYIRKCGIIKELSESCKDFAREIL